MAVMPLRTYVCPSQIGTLNPIAATATTPNPSTLGSQRRSSSSNSAAVASRPWARNVVVSRVKSGENAYSGTLRARRGRLQADAVETDVADARDRRDHEAVELGVDEAGQRRELHPGGVAELARGRPGRKQRPLQGEMLPGEEEPADAHRGEPERRRRHQLAQVRAGLHEHDDSDEEDPQQHRHGGELAKLTVPLEERGRRVGSQGERAEERQPAEDPDRLGTVGGVDVDEADEDRRQPVSEQRRDDAEADEHEHGAEQQARGVCAIVPRRVDREEARERGGDAAVERGQRAEGDQRQRPDAEAVGPEPADEHRRHEQRREDRRDLGEPVEADPRAEAARAEEGQPVRT